MEFERIKSIIKNSIKDADVRVNDLTGTADHLGILVISDEFEGKMLLAQHRLVMDALKESLKEEVHAVQLKTLTYEKAKAQGLIE